ncbi:AraC family transcriptional regulator [Streptococcus suis]|uniref:AraC family transcriptional regulator n=1 Tax=Streptococcus parasuis TaxID=1501662 RepID=UPI001554D5CC|nr:AraC family transcriptional regulator [Streptococcus suis]NQK66970.1 AraC family transcriptional regulator [Streptococcus suis]NQP54620.1 AraC family transcriptional regulator [Streptococcus suis]WNF86324.1 AraC family transcriptional regulator [Streptococcus parasuis]
MVKLEVKDNKKLVLKQVICKKLPNAKVEDVDHEINKFHQHLQLVKAQIFGPLIVKSCGTIINDDGSVSTDFELYVQAQNAQQYSNLYDIQDVVSIPNCLYVRFDDSPEYLQYAYSKLELYIYEQDIQTDGTVYTVYVNSSPDKMIVDIFRPVVSL